MKKNVVILILSLIILGLLGHIVCDKLSKEEISDPKINTTETYTYDTGIVGYDSLILNSKTNEFEFDLNMCSGILKTKGTYTKTIDKIVLTNITHNAGDEFNIPQEISLTIKSQNTLVLDERVGCVNELQEFIKK